MKNTLIALLTIVLLAVSPVAFAKECPLCVAAENGNLLKVKMLLENGANVNDGEEYDMTALMLTAANGHIEVVKLLLENGAHVNQKDKGGWTALMSAAANGRSEVAEVLLECGANPNIASNHGKNVWDVAIDKRTISTILSKHHNDVAAGQKFPPCNKTVTQ